MTSISKRQLIEESSAAPEFVAWIEEIGLISPERRGGYVPGDVFRVRMVSALLDAGFTRDEVGWALRQGALDLDHVDEYPIWDPPDRSDRSVNALVTDLEISPQMLGSLYRLFALPVPEPGASLLRDEESLIARFIGLWDRSGDPTTPERAARLLASGVRHTTMGWSELFGSTVAADARDRFMNREIDTFPEDIKNAAAAMMRLLPSMMTWLARRTMQEGVVAGIVESFEEVLASRGRRPGVRERVPRAVVFADLAGFTRLTEERGDEAAAASAAHLQQLTESVADGSGGRLVKLLGDGAMILFETPVHAVEASLGLSERFGSEHGVVSLHVGIHAGPVVERDQDIYGRTVNLASRIATVADPGEVLVSGEVVEAIDDHRFVFTKRAPATLKGIEGPVPLFLARRVDPVETTGFEPATSGLQSRRSTN